MRIMAIEIPAECAGQQREFYEALSQGCSSLGLQITGRERELMFAHFLQVVDANRHFNLTRITSPAEAAAKHYADSLTLLATPWVDRERPLTVLDVGTGAGFPAVPLAIMCLQWRIIAIDGTGKKTRFVAEVAKKLGLGNLEARHARAAEVKHGPGQVFDLVVMRAVDKIGKGLREVAHLVGSGGQVVFYKTAEMQGAEVEEGARVADKLGFGEAETCDVSLPAEDEMLRRRLVRFRPK